MLHSYPFLAPFLIASCSSVITVIATFIVLRKVSPIQSAALKNLVETQQNHVAELVAHANELRVERDDYKTRLHDARDKLQAACLRIKEFETRPDLGSLSALLIDQSTVLKSIEKSFADHSKSDAETFAKIIEILGKISTNGTGPAGKPARKHSKARP